MKPGIKINSQSRDALMAVCNQLVMHKLLPPRYKLPAIDASNSLSAFITETCEAIITGNDAQAEMLTAVLNALAHDLNDINQREPGLYKQLLKRLKKSLGTSDFYGFRHEIAVAAILLRQGQKIIGIERPDFQLEAGFSIECASARCPEKQALSSREISNKLRSVVSQKDLKDYASPKILLEVDITNITFLQLRGSALIPRETYQEAAAHPGAKFGSVLFTSTIADRNDRKLQRIYTRLDRPNIDPALVEYLNKFCPLGPGSKLTEVLAFREGS